MFKQYRSKPIVREAYQVQPEDTIVRIDDSTSEIYDIRFKHYEPVKPGDYIVRLSADDTYHCSQKVFLERNIVSTADQEMEDAFAAVYPKVSVELIDKAMAEVYVSTHVPEGTTTTLATAFIDVGRARFSLCTEQTSCVDPRNFNAELGAKYAIEKARTSARNKLWELEGYYLARTLV